MKNKEIRSYKPKTNEVFNDKGFSIDNALDEKDLREIKDLRKQFKEDLMLFGAAIIWADKYTEIDKDLLANGIENKTKRLDNLSAILQYQTNIREGMRENYIFPN